MSGSVEAHLGHAKPQASGLKAEAAASLLSLAVSLLGKQLLLLSMGWKGLLSLSTSALDADQALMMVAALHCC